MTRKEYRERIRSFRSEVKSDDGYPQVSKTYSKEEAKRILCEAKNLVNNSKKTSK